MELTNDFRVAVPPATAWSVLTDVERIAPCMPGAQLQEVHGEEYRGVVKVKVGPITAQYKGAATFIERDETNRKAVLKAEGRDTRGQGNANATITATLTPDGEGTRVTVVTDLHITGKVAQFGRGVIADVSEKLLGQFVDCLESTVLAGSATEAEPATWEAPAAPAAENTPPAVASSEPRKIDHPEAKPVDLIDTAGASVAKRAAPVLIVIAVLWLLRVLFKRRKK
jgi:carbon monoxide dehydrogenase subunit G